MKQVEPIAAAKTKPERRYDLDWLRVLAVLLLIYFHSAAIFYTGDLREFYIKNDSSSSEMQGFILFVHQWHMPLFFLLSGAATWFALSSRTVGEYVMERFKRLFIILHQTVVVAIAFYVVRWNIGISEKFFVISTASLVATIVLYDLLVRSNVVRFLFGLKPINHKLVAS